MKFFFFYLTSKYGCFLNGFVGYSFMLLIFVVGVECILEAVCLFRLFVRSHAVASLRI